MAWSLQGPLTRCTMLTAPIRWSCQCRFGCPRPHPLAPGLPTRGLRPVETAAQAMGTIGFARPTLATDKLARRITARPIRPPWSFL